MLFNSYIFLFGFLPVLFGACFVLRRRDPRYVIGLLACASLAFYTYWYPPYLVILISSILANFTISRLITKTPERRNKVLLAIGVLFNLGLLGYFKYAGFFIENFNFVTGQEWSSLQVLLPLGISFFTFQQIAFLADVYKGKADECHIIEYTLFVSFFPQLIAGPIVHHQQVMPQFKTLKDRIFQHSALCAGLALFSIGIFKKVVIADTLALYADPLFSAVENGYDASFLEAWGASLSYCFQIYFDFSGYTDMALGLGLLFGIRLPPNFNSPYKATGYIEFWRRWHITLSHFLRDYIYIPLGGNRHGSFRKYLNIGVTMLIGGLWHGASWNFVLWGGLHGLFIAVNHGLRHMFKTPNAALLTIGWLATFISLCLLWVFFRAESFAGALVIYKGLFDFGNILWPENIWNIIPAALQSKMSLIGMEGTILPYFKTVPMFVTLSLSAAVCFLLPSTASLFIFDTPGKARSLIADNLTFKPTLKWAVFCALLLVLSITLLQRESPFLYFQF